MFKVTLLFSIIAIAHCDICVKYDFEDGFEDLFPKNSGLCQSFSSWQKGSYYNTIIRRPNDESTKFITPIKAESVNEWQVLNSCIKSFDFKMVAGGTVEVMFYIEAVSERDILYVTANKIVPGGMDVEVGLARYSMANAGYRNGWHVLKIDVGGGNEHFDGYVYFLGTATQDAILLIDSFRYIGPSGQDENCILDLAIDPQTDAPPTTIAITTTGIPTTDVPTTDVPTTEIPTTEQEITDNPTTVIPTTTILPTEDENCITYDFEDYFDSKFGNESTFCIGSPRWTLDTFANINIGSPHVLSSYFIAPKKVVPEHEWQTISSCVTSFTFLMEARGIIEVKFYMEAKLQTDNLLIAAIRTSLGSNDVIVDRAMYSLFHPNYKLGWNTLQLEIPGENDEFEGHILFLGTASDEATLIVDSLRYFGPKVNEKNCVVYKDIETTTTVEPTTAEPTTAEPTTAEPTTAEPTTAEPATAEPTTAEPTTVEPTTAEPTTAEPTTAEPPTIEPTTAEPTTAEPTTAEPATAEPTTAEPTTVEPTTAEPTTAEPTTAEPPTIEPTTAEPTTAEPTTTEPTTAEPTTVEPTTVEPTTAEPTTAEPTTAKPTTAEPTTAEPTPAEPTTTEPTTAEPTTVEPTTVEPTTAEPTTSEPTTAEPTTAEPTTAEPTPAEPTTAEPTTAEPTTAEPTTVEPTTAEPTSAEPTTAEPMTAEPTTAEPTTSEPTTAEPSTAEPSTAEPTTAETTTAEPTTAEPTTAEPTTAEPTTAEPTTAEPTTAEPTTVEPTTAEPTTAEPTTAEPTTVEPTTAKPTTAELTTAQPTTVEPTTAEPTTTEPTTTEPTTDITTITSLPDVDEDCVTYDFEDSFDSKFDNDSTLCANSPRWNLNSYTNINVVRPHESSNYFMSPETVLTEHEWQTISSCVTSFEFSMAAGGIVEVKFYIEAKLQTDNLLIAAVRRSPGSNDAIVDRAMYSLLDPNYRDGWNILRINIPGGSGQFAGHILFLGTVSEDAVLMVDSFRYFGPTVHEDNCPVYTDLETTTSITDDLTTPTQTTLVPTTLIPTTVTTPPVEEDGCVTYNFEDDFDSLFTTANDLCVGYTKTWHLGNYSSIGMGGLTGSSHLFMKPEYDLSCIASFPFSMASGGIVEVNIFMESVSYADYISVLAKMFVTDSVDTVTGMTMYGPLGAGFVRGWNVLRFPIASLNDFNGYLVFLGAADEGSTVLVDSFRYIPPNVSEDHETCAIY